MHTADISEFCGLGCLPPEPGLLPALLRRLGQGVVTVVGAQVLAKMLFQRGAKTHSRCFWHVDRDQHSLFGGQFDQLHMPDLGAHLLADLAQILLIVEGTRSDNNQ